MSSRPAKIAMTVRIPEPMPASRLILISLVAVLSLVACGESTGTTSSAPSSTAAVTPTTPPAEDGSTTTAETGEAPELTGSWNVTHLFSAELGNPTNVWPDTEISLELAPDGTLSGNAGCNDYTGRYEVSGPYETETGFDNVLGQAMEISDLSWTEKACDSDNVMTQEQEYLQALQRVEQWWIGQGFGGDNDLILTSLEDGLMVEGSRE